MRPMRVELSGAKFVFPRNCSCCGEEAGGSYTATATRTKGKKVVTSTSRSWNFPHCDACDEHMKLYSSGNALAVLAVVAGVLLAFMVHWSVFIAGVVGAIAIVTNAHKRAEAARKPSCATASVPATFLGWSGTVQVFEIPSRDYATALMAANTGKLINLSNEGRAALLSAASATPKVAVRVVTEPPARETAEALLARWIVKLEAQKGPAGRRAVLAEALASTTDAAARDKLALEASRIEVEAVLDKVEGLKTPAAKRRNLEAALAAIKSDTVADELQAQQIQWLENALQSLEQ